MPEESVATLVEHLPTTIDEIESARSRILHDTTSFNQFSEAFYARYGGGAKDPRQKLEEAIGRYLLGQQGRTRDLLRDLKGPLVEYLRARLHLNVGQWDLALRSIKEVLDQHPDCLPARMARVEALFQKNESQTLSLELHQLEKDHPDSVDITYIQGLIHEIEGEYDQATRLYGQTLAVDQNHVGALFRLAFHESLRGEADSAVDLYERLCALLPTHAGALLNLGLLFEDEEDYQLATTCFQKVLDFDSTSWRARMYFKDSIASQSMLYDEERERKEDKRAQVLRIPVTDFELSVRSRNCLANMNVRTLGDLIKLSEQELLSFKNFGETSLHEIKQILTQKGLRLGMAAAEEGERASPTVRALAAHGPVDPDSVMARAVLELELSVRSRKALDALNVRSIGELIKIPESRLLACKNFGQTSLMEIKKKLGDLGLSLST